ncbi:unnamed protein product [Chrysodeixis includens]|uniref:Uncharacterized protein n=1 Tax=Chrysodeixis includens TaxID=689277 RepID=A0A9N8KW45_CHRIL|nr:unnamed protein product [Chrysodeixis includens]
MSLRSVRRGRGTGAGVSRGIDPAPRTARPPGSRTSHHTPARCGGAPHRGGGASVAGRDAHAPDTPSAAVYLSAASLRRAARRAHILLELHYSDFDVITRYAPVIAVFCADM